MRTDCVPFRTADLPAMTLVVLQAADMAVAHPRDVYGPNGPQGYCRQCVYAVRPDTGEIVLLWLCERKNWTVSRENPEYDRHRLELME
jgi:hypothetical protein